MRALSCIMVMLSITALSVSCKPTRAQDQSDQGSVKASSGDYFVAWEAHAVDDDLTSTITLRSVLIEQRADGSARVAASKVGQALIGDADKAWVMKVVEGSTPGLGCPECDSSDEPCFEQWRKNASEIPLATSTLELTPLHPNGQVIKYRLAANPPNRHEGSHKERIVPASQVGSHLFLESNFETFYCFTDGSMPELERQTIDLKRQQAAPLVTAQVRASLESELMSEAMARGKAQYGEAFEADQVTLKLSDIQLIYTEADKLVARYTFEGECNSCGAMVDEPEAVSLAVESDVMPQGITSQPTPPAIIEYWKNTTHKEKVLGRGWSKLAVDGATLEKVIKSFN